jgi:two-component system cell cycle sensor histidine kinase/response regulator CckA
LFLVKADAGQLQQVMLNLAINARDAMPDGGRLTIRTLNRELAEPLVIKKTILPVGAYAVIEVVDTGHGISAEVFEHLFEPFYTTKQPGEGTGLGLSMAYGIVKQSGGEISVTTAADRGTTFTLYLPRAREEQADRGTHPVASGSGSGTGTILLVEDEELVRTLAVTVLTKSGYKVLEAGQGGEALDFTARYRERIDLLITDVVMPGINGVELAGRIRESHPGIKVLFMSGYSEKAVVRLPEDAAFLQKPFSLGELAEKVRSVLAGSVGQ